MNCRLMSINKFLSISLFASLMLIYCSSSHAITTTDIFRPDAIKNNTDVSIYLLGLMFGSVDGVLHGMGSEIFGSMFYFYNVILMAIGGFVVLYTTLVSTLNTAQEGEFLGKKWNSVWIPIRSALGLALLLPKASGYSLIQIIFMFIIVHGVAAADSTWNAALKYVVGSGTIMPAPPDKSQIGPVIDLATNILRNEVCIYSYQTLNNKSSGVVTNLNLYAGFYQSPTQPNNDYVNPEVDFPVQLSLPLNTSLQPAFCGKMTWPNPLLTAAGDSPTLQAAKRRLAVAQRTALWQMVLDLQPIALQIAQDPVGADCQDSTDTNGTCLTATALEYAALDYMNLLKPALAEYQIAIGNVSTAAIQGAMDQGWVLAGAYYKTLAGINSGRADYTTQAQQVNITTNAYTAKGIAGAKTPPGVDPTIWKNVVYQVSGNITDDVANNAKDRLVGGANRATRAPSFDFANSVSAGFAQAMLGVMTGGMSAVGIFWKNSFESSNVDPIIAVMSFGQQCITLVTSIWLVVMVLIIVVAAISSFDSCESPTYWMFQAFMLWYVPVIFMIMSAIFIMGCVLSFYVPLIPYIIFLMGAMGWFISVIEAMIAAPLVALGIAHPEGNHEIVGRAEPAIMLAINAFLRPSFMIIGFVIGILLSYVGMQLLNFGFDPAVNGMGVAATNSMAGLFGVVALMIIYTAIVLQLINKAFSLINEIPNKVIRWIGGVAQNYGDAREELHAVEGAVQSGAQTYGKAVSDGAKTMMGEYARKFEIKKPGDKDNPEVQSLDGKGQAADGKDAKDAKGNQNLQGEEKIPPPML